MNRLKTLATAAIALAAFTGTAQAADREWTGRAQDWQSASLSTCKARVTKVLQVSPGQPVRLVVTNTSQARMLYSFSVRIVEPGNNMFLDIVDVESANPGESVERATSKAFGGVLRDSKAYLSLIACFPKM